MKNLGLGRRGALLAVLLLLVSGSLLPLSAQAAGKKLWGQVTDCATTDPVAALVSLVDVHAQAPVANRSTDALSGVFIYQPDPGYYKVRITPNSYTHYTRDAGPYRFDGTQHFQVPTAELCVDAMPKKDRFLNVTAVDGSANTVTGEAVSFQEYGRGPENVTTPDPVTGDVQYDSGEYYPLRNFLINVEVLYSQNRLTRA